MKSNCPFEKKEQLQILQSHNEGEKAKRDDERNARIASIAKINSLNQSKLTSLLVQSKLQLQSEQNVHTVSNQYFDRRRSVITKNTNDWNEKYRNNIGDATTTLKNLTDRIESASREFIELTPKKEEAAELLKLEIVRDVKRTKQTEIRSTQELFMGKLKVLYMLHVIRRGRFPRRKKRGKK